MADDACSSRSTSPLLPWGSVGAIKMPVCLHVVNCVVSSGCYGDMLVKPGKVSVRFTWLKSPAFTAGSSFYLLAFKGCSGKKSRLYFSFLSPWDMAEARVSWAPEKLAACVDVVDIWHELWTVESELKMQQKTVFIDQKFLKCSLARPNIAVLPQVFEGHVCIQCRILKCCSFSVSAGCHKLTTVSPYCGLWHWYVFLLGCSWLDV